MNARSTTSLLSALAFASIAAAGDTGAWVPPPTKPSAALAYANTDGSTGFPLLTANDMVVYMDWFFTGDPRANCDQSTGKPLLTANDLQCFLNVWVEALEAQAAMNPTR